MGISRIEQFEKTNFGYYVRLKRNGQQYAKFFSDSRFGGQQNALRAAQQHLNELSQQLPRKSQAGQMSVRNTSGIVGVSLTKSTRKGHTYEYWQAWWGSRGDRKSRKFSINKYGMSKAKQLAVETRKAWEQEARHVMHQ